MKKNPLNFFMPVTKSTKERRQRPLDGKLCDDIEGVVDNAWHKAMRKYVPEIVWNPNHSDRATETTKGGPGSGNHDHGGLPGVHGGSSPTKTKPTPWKEVPTSEGKINLSKADGKPQYAQLEKVAAKMGGFCGTDPSTGYRVDCRKISVEYSHLRYGTELTLNYSGAIYDQKGEHIGEVDLNYLPADNSGEISLIYMAKENRKAGFGRNYIDHVEDVFFDEVGVKNVHLLAGLDVGGYFWARAGYDFIQDSEKKWAIEWLGKEWQYRYNESVPKNILKNLNHTWDIASLVGPDGFKIGKQTMLGVSWRGEKTPDGIGRKIGKEYYKLN